MSTISQLASTIGAGARASKYRVAFAFPSSVAGFTSLEDVDILAKASVAPQKEIGQLEIWNQGRKAVLPGDTVFDNAWSCDFYLTEDHAFRLDMLRWMDSCDNFQANTHTGNPLAVMTDLRIEQLDSAGEVTAQYTMHKCFPQVIGEITYSDDQVDTMGEFNVTFTYTDWVSGVGEFSDYSPKTATKNETAAATA